MEEAIRKAKVLIEALSWIQRFRGRYVVVKLGGSTLDDVAAVNSLLTDVVFMATVGMKPVRLAAYEEACWRLGKRCLIYNYVKLKFKICILLQKLGKLLIIIFLFTSFH